MRSEKCEATVGRRRRTHTSAFRSDRAKSTPVRVFLIIVGLVLILGGVACGAPSVVTFRALDGDGYISGGGRMSTSTAAFITRTAQFKEVSEEEVEEGRTGGDVRLRIAAERPDGGDVVVAIGSAEAVQSLVVRGSSEVVSQLDFEPFEYTSVALGGSRPLGIPEEGLFVEFAGGPGRQEIIWTVEPGEWRAVIMNADGSPGVDVDVDFGARFPYLRGFAIAGIIIGGTVLLLGVVLLVIQFRPGRTRGEHSAGDDMAVAEA